MFKGKPRSIRCFYPSFNTRKNIALGSKRLQSDQNVQLNEAIDDLSDNGAWHRFNGLKELSAASATHRPPLPDTGAPSCPKPGRRPLSKRRRMDEQRRFCSDFGLLPELRLFIKPHIDARQRQNSRIWLLNKLHHGQQTFSASSCCLMM